MKNDLKYTLDRSNTTAGKLSEVLGIVDKRDARIKVLEEALTKMKDVALMAVEYVAAANYPEREREAIKQILINYDKFIKE